VGAGRGWECDLGGGRGGNAHPGVADSGDGGDPGGGPPGVVRIREYGRVGGADRAGGGQSGVPSGACAEIAGAAEHAVAAAGKGATVGGGSRGRVGLTWVRTGASCLARASFLAPPGGGTVKRAGLEDL